MAVNLTALTNWRKGETSAKSGVNLSALTSWRKEKPAKSAINLSALDSFRQKDTQPERQLGEILTHQTWEDLESQGRMTPAFEKMKKLGFVPEPETLAQERQELKKKFPQGIPLAYKAALPEKQSERQKQQKPRNNKI